MSKLPIFEHFLSVGNVKQKLNSFFKPKLEPKLFLLNRPPEGAEAAAAVLGDGAAEEHHGDGDDAGQLGGALRDGALRAVHLQPGAEHAEQLLERRRGEVEQVS